MPTSDEQLEKILQKNRIIHRKDIYNPVVSPVMSGRTLVVPAADKNSTNPPIIDIKTKKTTSGLKRTSSEAKQ